MTSSTSAVGIYSKGSCGSAAVRIGGVQSSFGRAAADLEPSAVPLAPGSFTTAPPPHAVATSDSDKAPTSRFMETSYEPRRRTAKLHGQVGAGEATQRCSCATWLRLVR